MGLNTISLVSILTNFDKTLEETYSNIVEMIEECCNNETDKIINISLSIIIDYYKGPYTDKIINLAIKDFHGALSDYFSSKDEEPVPPKLSEGELYFNKIPSLINLSIRIVEVENNVKNQFHIKCKNYKEN